MPSIRSTSSTRPAKKKVSPGDQGRGEIVLDRAELAAVPEADVEQRRVDDDPGVHPVLLDEARMRDPPACRPASRVSRLKLVIGAQRIAAALDEAEHLAGTAPRDSPA